MAWCRASITLTQSRTHSIAWICSGGSHFPTTLSTDDYWSQDILHRTWWSSAQSSDSTSVLELGKYNHIRETYVLGVYEWDYTKLKYTIDGCDWCRRQKLPSMPSHEQMLYRPNEFRQWPTPRYPGYQCGTGWLVGRCMSSGVETRRNGGPRLGSGGNESIVSELGTAGKLSVGHSFLLFLLFSSLLHHSSLLSISARYVWRRYGFYHLQITVDGGWSFPVRRIRRKVTLSGTEWLWDLWVRTIVYVGWLFYSMFPLSSLLLFIPLCFLGSWRSTNGVGMGCYHLSITAKGRWSLPVRRIHRKATVRCQSVARRLSLYEYVRGAIV